MCWLGRYKLDSSFLRLPAGEVLTLLQESLEKLRAQAERLEAEREECEEGMTKLKAILYAKFGCESAFGLGGSRRGADPCPFWVAPSSFHQFGEGGLSRSSSGRRSMRWRIPPVREEAQLQYPPLALRALELSTSWEFSAEGGFGALYELAWLGAITLQRSSGSSYVLLLAQCLAVAQTPTRGVRAAKGRGAKEAMPKEGVAASNTSAQGMSQVQVALRTPALHHGLG